MKKAIASVGVLVLVLGITSTIAKADLVVDGSIVNFGIESVGQVSAQQNVVIENTYPNTTVTGIEMIPVGCDPAFNLNTDCPANLGAGQACDLWGTFTPQSPINYQCTVRIGAQSETGEADLTLMGDGIM